LLLYAALFSVVAFFFALLAELPYHIQVMVMIAMCLGLRISEIRALQRQDFDLKGRILTLTRSIAGRYVWNGGKTGASEDDAGGPRQAL
jgi:integrase